MKRYRTARMVGRLLGTIGVLFLGFMPLALAQEKVLRIDEVAVGELDPAKATDYADSMLMFNVYDTLVWPDAEGKLRSHLAQSWSVSPDGRTYTFTLRRGVRFHDNSEVTAEDVVFSLERMVAINQGYSYLFRGWVKEARALDRYQVRFTLTEPYAPFLATLVRLPIVNKGLVLKNLRPGNFGQMGDYGQAFLSRMDAGSGAYRVVSHDPQSLTVMARFPNYFLGFARGAPDLVRLRYSLEAPTVRTLMVRQEHEITSQWLPPEILRALAQAGKDLVSEGGSSIFFLKLNNKRPPTDDVHFRRAMALAFDYDALLKILQVTDKVLMGKKARGPLPEGFPGFDASLPIPKKDLAAARAELAKSKYDPRQVRVEIAWVAEVPLEEKIALLLQQNLAEIGIQADVVKVPWALMTERASRPDSTPNVSAIYVSATFPDPDSLLYSMYHSKAAGTWLSMSWLQDKQVDDLLDQGRRTVDEGRRKEIYARLQRYLVENQVDIFGYEQVAVFAKQPYMRIPTLENPQKQVAGVMAGNWLFRLMEIKR